LHFTVRVFLTLAVTVRQQPHSDLPDFSVDRCAVRSTRRLHFLLGRLNHRQDLAGFHLLESQARSTYLLTIASSQTID
jgi:hypothetical protein